MPENVDRTPLDNLPSYATIRGAGAQKSENLHPKKTNVVRLKPVLCLNVWKFGLENLRGRGAGQIILDDRI